MNIKKILIKNTMVMSLIAGMISGSALNANAYITRDTDRALDAITFTDTDTGEKCTVSSSNMRTGETYITRAIKAKTITTDVYAEGNTVYLDTPYDTARFGNFRSNKKDLKVKVIARQEDNSTDLKYYVIGDDGKKYCRNVFGNKLAFTDEVRKEAEKTNKYHAYGSYQIMLYTKKPGTYKFYYDALDHNGNKIITKSFKVIAREDGNPVKEATFAGKRFYVSYNQRYKGITDNLYTAKDGIYTTKKSGKLKIVMNKGFKIKKIEVGYRPVGYTKESRADKWRLECKPYEWTEVKNGRKITLNTTDEGISDYGRVKKHVAPGGYRVISTESHAKTAMTTIRITYYDKKNKTTDITYLGIYKLINK